MRQQAAIFADRNPITLEEQSFSRKTKCGTEDIFVAFQMVPSYLSCIDFQLPNGPERLGGNGRPVFPNGVFPKMEGDLVGECSSHFLVRSQEKIINGPGPCTCYDSLEQAKQLQEIAEARLGPESSDPGVIPEWSALP